MSGEPQKIPAALRAAVLAIGGSEMTIEGPGGTTVLRKMCLCPLCDR